MLLVPAVLLAEAVEQGVDRVDVEPVVRKVVEAADVRLGVAADAVDQDQGLAVLSPHSMTRGAMLTLHDAGLRPQQLDCDDCHSSSGFAFGMFFSFSAFVMR